MSTFEQKLVAIGTEVRRLELEMSALRNPSPGQLLHDNVTEHQRKLGGSYSEALTAVMGTQPDLAKQYTESFSSHRLLPRNRRPR